jgi:hypothetical protein
MFALDTIAGNIFFWLFVGFLSSVNLYVLGRIHTKKSNNGDSVEAKIFLYISVIYALVSLVLITRLQVILFPKEQIPELVIGLNVGLTIVIYILAWFTEPFMDFLNKLITYIGEDSY